MATLHLQVHYLFAEQEASVHMCKHGQSHACPATQPPIDLSSVHLCAGQGTAAFASINAHLGFLPSLATELENGFYVLLSLAGMRMPWLVAEVVEAFDRSCPSSAKQVNLYLQAKLSWLFGLSATYPQVVAMLVHVWFTAYLCRDFAQKPLLLAVCCSALLV